VVGGYWGMENGVGEESQGKFIMDVGYILWIPVFTHGQFHVMIS
jgi:hypothetical protein